MSRQIIQTETKGWTPAMRRRLVVALALVAVMLGVIFIALHGQGVHPALHGV